MTEIEIIEQYVCGKQMFKVAVKNGKENIMIVNCSRFEQTATMTYMYNGAEYIGMIDSGKIVEFSGYMTNNMVKITHLNAIRTIRTLLPQSGPITHEEIEEAVDSILTIPRFKELVKQMLIREIESLYLIRQGVK